MRQYLGLVLLGERVVDATYPLKLSRQALSGARVLARAYEESNPGSECSVESVPIGIPRFDMMGTRWKK